MDSLFRILLFVFLFFTELSCSHSVQFSYLNKQIENLQGYFIVKPNEIIDLEKNEHIDQKQFDQCEKSKIKKVAKTSSRFYIDVVHKNKNYQLVYILDSNTDLDEQFKNVFKIQDQLNTDIENNKNGKFSNINDLCNYRLKEGSTASDLYFIKGYGYEDKLSNEYVKKYIYYGDGLFKYDVYYLKNNIVIKIEEIESKFNLIH